MRVVPRVYFELSVPEYICIPGFLLLCTRVRAAALNKEEEMKKCTGTLQ